MKQYLVLDFGGTYTKYALMDENGAFLERGKVDSRCEDLDRMLASVAPLKEQFAGQFEGVAVSMPGRIDTANGVLLLTDQRAIPIPDILDVAIQKDALP